MPQHTHGQVGRANNADETYFDNLSTDELSDLIRRLLQIRTNRERECEDSVPDTPAPRACGQGGGANNTPSGPHHVVTITSTITPVGDQTQVATATQTVVVPLTQRIVTSPAKQNPTVSTLPQMPRGDSSSSGALAPRRDTTAWYSVMRARAVGVIYNWYAPYCAAVGMRRLVV